MRKVKIPHQLDEIARRVKQGENPAVQVRQLLGWFDAERRGYRIIRQIGRALKQAKLLTVPNFDGAYIDSSVAFYPVVGAGQGPDGATQPSMGSAVVDNTIAQIREKLATRISSGQTAACRATLTQRFWILWLLWMLPTGARAVLMRSSNASFPLAQLENSLSCAAENIEGFPEQAKGSHGVYAEGEGFCVRLLPPWRADVGQSMRPDRTRFTWAKPLGKRKTS
jgi:hypothetical protein